MQIIRGTTPTIIINVKDDIDFSQIMSTWIFISQRGKVRVDKTIRDITVNPLERRIKLPLSQEDTLNLKEGDAIIQVRILMSDGTALSSLEKEIEVLPTGKEGEIEPEQFTPEQWTVGPEPTIERIKLNLIPIGNMPICHASQFDKKRQIEIEIYNGAQPYFLSDEELELIIKKPDGNLVSMDIPYEVGSNSIIFETTEQTCAVAGKCLCELRVTKGESKLGSLNFYLQVEGAPDEGGITSQSEINNLNRQIDDYLDETLPEVLDDDVPPIVERIIDETLAPVAKSGNYNDLENKPSIPAAQVNSDWNAKSGVSQILNKPTIPTKTSQLQNDSGFTTIDDSEASASKVYSSNKVENIANTKANSSDVEYRKNTYTKINPTNTWTSGYYWGKTAYENSSYAYSSFLNVSAGDIVTISENAQFRFVEVYNSNGDIIDSISSFVTTYTVPNGATSMVLTVSSSNLERKYPIIDKFSIVTCFKRNKGYSNFYLVFPSVSSGDLMTLVDHIDNKKNCEYFFTGKFSSFTSLEIGHGKTSGAYCVIDNTNITVYVSGTQVQQFAHGLTLTDFITVSIKCGDIANARGSITIQTNGGYYRKDDNFIFTGCKDTIYFIPLQSMTDCEFAYTIMDSRKDIFVFGDSYISLADSKKWVKYAIEDNDNNMLLCGYSGAKSTDEIIPFRKLNEQRNPLFVCWLLGMNDADNGSINADWKACVDEVIEYCNSHDIVPILATIPNTPNIDHTYKNAYVKASGCRYIDFAKAVNAENVGATWYSGMLGSDNVHPTEEGAKALWLRAILDCPELIN